ncbi:hypothetical protein [Nocardioides zeae]|uniref:DUF2567 domain-containing protein n=1 Tax=Nocardioides zeae TaxID=1457234 RepID=A0A6P0HEI3_9ACTN|nr:hypothetical protein [Nocardioides zeae]NEN77031.1 hypothetical protein [Nocardioides zeae]
MADHGAGRPVTHRAGRAAGLRADAVAVLRLVHVAAQLGVIGALVWVWWWHPGSGVASGGEFYPRVTSIEGTITGTAAYLVVAAAAGGVLGAVAAWWNRDRPWVGLLGAVLAAAVGGLVLAWLGHLLGPEDPVAVAARSADGTKVPYELVVEGRGAYFAMPAGAATVVALALLLVRDGRRAVGEEQADTRGSVHA